MNAMLRAHINDLACAVRRYPDAPPELALCFLHSDRRAAGLGAMDESKRRATGSWGERRSKFVDLFGDQRHVVYEMCSVRRETYRIVPHELGPISDFKSVKGRTFQTERIEARHLCMRRVVGFRELREDRTRIARFLRAMRVEFAEAKAAHP